MKNNIYNIHTCIYTQKMEPLHYQSWTYLELSMSIMKYETYWYRNLTVAPLGDGFSRWKAKIRLPYFSTLAITWRSLVSDANFWNLVSCFAVPFWAELLWNYSSAFCWFLLSAYQHIHLCLSVSFKIKSKCISKWCIPLILPPKFAELVPYLTAENKMLEIQILMYNT